MIKKILFLTFLATQLLAAQNPVFEANFNGTLEHENLEVGVNIHLAQDRNSNDNSASYLGEEHSKLAINYGNIDTQLNKKGTIVFWHRHVGYGTSSIGVSRPIFYMTNGNTSYHEGLVLALNHYTQKLRLVSYEAYGQGFAEDLAMGIPSGSYTWTQYALSYDFESENKFIKVYMNGVLVYTRAITHSMPQFVSTQKMYFLGSNEINNSLIGYIDDIKLFDENLNQSKILDLYIDGAENEYEPIANTVRYDFSNNLQDSYGNYDLISYGENNNSYTTSINDLNKAIVLSTANTHEDFLQIPLAYNEHIANDYSVTICFKVPEHEHENNSYYDYWPLITMYNNDEYYYVPRLTIGVNKDPQNRKLVMMANRYYSFINITTLTPGNWYVLSVVHQNNTTHAYVNGKLLISSSSDDSVISSTRATEIGRTVYYYESENYFGDIDVVMIEPKFYTPNEVTNIHRNILRNTNESLSIITPSHQTNKINAYPNPSTGIINFSEPIQADVFDTQGRLIIQQDNVLSVDLTNQNSGVYFIKMSTSAGTEVIKIIKK